MSVREHCVGPWAGSPPKDLNYDLDMLGRGGYDPANVLTCICSRCGARWSYDSPSAECRGCERETLVEHLMDERRLREGEPPLYERPPSRGKYEVVMTDTFLKSYAALSGEDEATARACLRGRGLHMAQARPTREDREEDELRSRVKYLTGREFVSLPEETRGRWRKWWATRTTYEPPVRSLSETEESAR